MHVKMDKLLHSLYMHAIVLFMFHHVQSGWGINPDQEVIDYIEDLFKLRRLKEDAELDCTPLHVAVFKST